MRISVLAFFLFFFCGLIVFSACDEKHETEPSYPVDGDTCDRTVLVYMLGSNTLGGFVESNISAMKKAVEKGALHNGNLLLYIDRYNTVPTLEKLSLRDGAVERTVVKSYEDRNSATVEAMSSVCDDVRTLYPASSFGLILWSHANGWYPFHIEADLSAYSSTRSFGDDEGNAMNIDEISLAIPDSMFDFILCDACYMGAVEVAYDLREDCRYYVASPAAVMGGGFPYEDIVEHLFYCDKPIPENLIDVCRVYMDYYRSYYDPYGTISLIDMREIEALARSVKLALVNSVDSLQVSEIQQLSQEKGTRVSYQNLFFDLNDYVGRVCVDTLAYSIFADCLDRTVLYADATNKGLSNILGAWVEFPIEQYCGLAAYIPGASSDEVADLYYKTLSWYKTVYGGMEVPIKITN